MQCRGGNASLRPAEPGVSYRVDECPTGNRDDAMGSRDVSVSDPFGNRLTFTNPIST